MSDIISFGRLLSLCCIVAFYISGRMITVDCLKNYDDFFQHVFKITNRNCFNGDSYDKLICNDSPAYCKAAYQL